MSRLVKNLLTIDKIIELLVARSKKTPKILSNTSYRKKIKRFRPNDFTLSSFLIDFRLDLSLRILKEVEIQWFEKFKILDSTGNLSSKRQMKFPPFLLQYGKGSKNNKKKRFLVPCGHRDVKAQVAH